MRKQIAFASLTEAEIQQIAEWLRTGKYDEVRERIAKPRPEGFGLTVSRKPLQLLWTKTNRVDRINARIASGQRLTLAEYDAIEAGEKADVAEEVHDAIMDATYAMVTSEDNTPTQLIALQRLADFPARAENREHKRQLELRKEERQEKALAHKTQMDLEKAARKKDMDDHRKRMAEERLALQKRALDLRESRGGARVARAGSGISPEPNSPLTTNHSPLSDELGPFAATLDEIEERACRKFGYPLPNRSNRTGRSNEAHESQPNNGNTPSLPPLPSIPTTPLKSEISNLESSPTAAQLHNPRSSASSAVNNPSPLPPFSPVTDASRISTEPLTTCEPVSLTPCLQTGDPDDPNDSRTASAVSESTNNEPLTNDKGIHESTHPKIPNPEQT